jgi:hypothetical protein
LPQEHTQAPTLFHRSKHKLPPFATGAIESFTGTIASFQAFPQEKSQASICKLSTFSTGVIASFYSTFTTGAHTSFNQSFGLDTDRTDHRQLRQNLNTD